MSNKSIFHPRYIVKYTRAFMFRFEYSSISGTLQLYGEISLREPVEKTITWACAEYKRGEKLPIRELFERLRTDIRIRNL